MDKRPAESGKRVSGHAFSVAVGSALSLVVAMANQMVIARLFGAGAEMDAYFTALIVPVYLQTILVASLSFVIVPAFVREDTEGDKGRAWALAGTYFWLTLGILGAIALAGSFFTRTIIGMSAPGLSPGQADLAARMLGVMIFSLPLNGLASLTSGIQNARDDFFWPAVANALSSAGNIAIALTFQRFYGATSLAWAYLIGTALAAAVTVTPVLRHGWQRLLPLGDPTVRELARLMTPFILFGALTRCIPLIERYFASGLSNGAISYLAYGEKTGRAIGAVIGQSIVTAIFPAMAHAYAARGETGLVRQTEDGMRLSFASALPVVTILSALTVPIISLLFERGNFDHAATLAVSQVLPIFLMIEVLYVSFGNLINRSYYITQDTLTVPVVGIVSALGYIVIAGFLADRWGYIGLALARAITPGLSIVFLTALMMRRLPYFQKWALLRSTLLYVAAGLAAGLCAWGLSRVVEFLPTLAQLALVGVVGSLSYLAILWRFDNPIARAILEMFGVTTIGQKLRLLRPAN